MRNSNRFSHARSDQEQALESSIQVRQHDGALVGSVTLHLDLSYDQALMSIKSQIETIAEAVESAGGMVGHIKFHLEGSPRRCNLFLTEPGDLQEKSIPDVASTAHGAVIVFGITEAVFEQILTDTFPDVPWENEFVL